MTATGPSLRTASTRPADNRPGVSDLRISTACTRGQPFRCADRSGVRRRSETTSASSDGAGELSTHGIPARRARSMATSRAFHAGVRSSLYAESCSSRTTIDVSPETGASAAVLVPTTTALDVDRAQCSGYSATVRPPRLSSAARKRRSLIVGASRSVRPRDAAARARGTPRSAGMSSTSVTPACSKTGSKPSSAQARVCPDCSGFGSAATILGGEAARRKCTVRPYQRWAAHSARARISAGGPTLDHLRSGATSTELSCSTSTAVIHPAVRRPAKSTRTSDPTATLSARPSSSQDGGTS